MRAYDQDKDVIAVQSLAPLKIRAKDDQGKTYWVYPIEEQLENYENKAQRPMMRPQAFLGIYS